MALTKEERAANERARRARIRLEQPEKWAEMMERDRAWRAANRDKVKAYHAANRERHRDARNARKRDWYRRNADRAKDYAKEYYATHKEKYSSHSSKRYARMLRDEPERIAIYFAKSMLAGELGVTHADLPETLVQAKAAQILVTRAVRYGA